MFLRPSKIPPKIVINNKFDKKKSPFNEFIVVGPTDSAIGKVNYKLYVNSTLYQYSTLNGYLKYDIQNCDSIQFSILEESFTVYPNNYENPSWIKVFIDANNVDLFDRFIQNRKLYIKDNEIKYNLKKEYSFKKVGFINWIE